MTLASGSTDVVLALLRPVSLHILALSLALSAGGVLGSGALLRCSSLLIVMLPPALLEDNFSSLDALLSYSNWK